jgi:hypothetical protein
MLNQIQPFRLVSGAAVGQAVPRIRNELTQRLNEIYNAMHTCDKETKETLKRIVNRIEREVINRRTDPNLSELFGDIEMFCLDNNVIPIPAINLLLELRTFSRNFSNREAAREFYQELAPPTIPNEEIGWTYTNPRVRLTRAV